MEKEKKITVYINPSWNGVAIFSKEDSDEPCLYFTAWFYEPDFWRLSIWGTIETPEDFEDERHAFEEYFTTEELAELKAIVGKKPEAEEMIRDFCSDYDRWDGGDPEESGIKNFDQFWELMQEEPGWFCIY